MQYSYRWVSQFCFSMGDESEGCIGDRQVESLCQGLNYGSSFGYQKSQTLDSVELYKLIAVELIRKAEMNSEQ